MCIFLWQGFQTRSCHAADSPAAKALQAEAQPAELLYMDGECFKGWEAACLVPCAAQLLMCAGPWYLHWPLYIIW